MRIKKMWISKKKYEELIKRINTIEEKTSKLTPYGPKWFDHCRDDINDIQRVMKNSKLGEITHKSILDKNDINYLLITTHLSPDFIISNENKSQTIKKYAVTNI